MSNNVDIQKETCTECGAVYDRKIFVVMGIRMRFDSKLCPTCRAKRDVELIAREIADILAAQAKRRLEWRQGCGIPDKFMDKEFGNYEKARQLKAYNKCLDYAKNFPLLSPKGYRSLLLFGANGTGKTHLVCAIAHHILNKWHGEEILCPVLVASEPDLFRRIQATYNITPEKKVWHEVEDDVFNQLIRVPLLILDDIGKDERSDPRFVQRVLFAVIDGRYKLNRPMVLTSNLTPEELCNHLGGSKSNEASYDRIVEMCGGKFIKMEGESYRRLKK